MKKVAVVGAGIFGSSAAILLARNGYDVTLFDKEADILQAASGINQYRLHRGYHYPRSKDTAFSSKHSEDSFLREYGDAVYSATNHLYALAKYDSKINHEYFAKFCDQCGLEYQPHESSLLSGDLIESVLKVKESLINPSILKEIVEEKLKNGCVELILNHKAERKELEGYDYIVNATYASLNSLIVSLEQKRKYQYEVCEKPVLKLPEKFQNHSIVIIDGPFTCIDPLGGTDYHLMGNVVHAIHSTNVGYEPVISPDIAPLLNKGIIKNPKVTNIDKFIEVAEKFMPGISDSEYIGSMYTVRTVLPHVDHSDERPTHTYWLDEKVINVFSGKIGNSVKAAEDVLDLLRSK